MKSTGVRKARPTQLHLIRVELFADQLRILNSQFMSQLKERQVQVLGHQMQALGFRLKQLESQKPPPR